MSIYYLSSEDKLERSTAFNPERDDPSLNGLKAHSLLNEFRLSPAECDRLFFAEHGIVYITKYFTSRGHRFRVVSHPAETDTCFEKAELMGAWNPLNVIKALYFENLQSKVLYAVVLPETGCFVNRARIKELLGLPGTECIRKATQLPQHMSFGTCSPFVVESDLRDSGGLVERIIFDTQALEFKSRTDDLDDFSFGLDHRMSVQMSYYRAFEMLKDLFPGAIRKENILNLSFKERLVRSSGRINISFEFNSLDYQTAQFINGIHGYGEVSIINDYVDELDDRSLPRGRSSFVGTRARLKETSQ
jgi:hypothetical protein